jgi:Uma2 family endonuclease
MSSNMIVADEHLSILAANVSEDEYMNLYAELGCEWVEGVVIKLAPIGIKHDHIFKYLVLLMQNYFTLNSIGQVFGDRFVMRLPEFPKRRREPDMMIVLDTNPHLRETYMDGPADICVEIVSEASVNIDLVEKFHEYEVGGVREYWIVDALNDECIFYRLNDQKVYVQHMQNAEGVYTTPVLPRLQVHVPTLWTVQRPNTIAVLESVRHMFDEPHNEDNQ